MRKILDFIDFAERVLWCRMQNSYWNKKATTPLPIHLFIRIIPVCELFQRRTAGLSQNAWWWWRHHVIPVCENQIAHGCQNNKNITKICLFDRFDVCLLKHLRFVSLIFVLTTGGDLISASSSRPYELYYHNYN